MPTCPATDCRATGKVTDLSPYQVQEIKEAWTTQAARCTYCGTVFTGDGRDALIRGSFDDPMGKQGWVPR